MGRNIGQPMITTSVRISPEFHQLARQHFLNFSECLAMGISLALAEKGVQEYNTNLNIVRQKIMLADKLVKYAEKFGGMEDGNQ